MRHEDEVRQAEAHDHARAGERGEKLRRISEDVVSALIGQGMVFDARQAKVVIFHVVSDHLFGNRAIDIPEFD